MKRLALGIGLLLLIAGAAGMVVDFSADMTTGSAPLTVTFNDLSSDSPTGWAWFFGDETYAGAWTEMNASGGWVPRKSHTSVSLPDGSIVLTGGDDNSIIYSDVWRSPDRGTTWTLMNASAWAAGRADHTSVVLPDGSIVLMGGDEGSYKNDVWRSTDSGSVWTQVNASAAWSRRHSHTSVALPDGSIVLMGGFNISLRMVNDTWRSTDGGNLWMLMNASSGWSNRSGHTSVVLPDTSIVLTGGWEGYTYKNDTWRSTDMGATWILMNASPGWLPRGSHSSVALPDGSIVLMGGTGGAPGYFEDIWRSTDKGATWTQVNAHAGWSARVAHASVVLPDGSIVLMGGNRYGYVNDTWRFQPAGSTLRNPSHIYTVPGTYQVSLQASNATAYNSTQKTGYITVTSPAPSTPGLYQQSTGYFFLKDSFTAGPADLAFQYGAGGSDWSPLIGDWDGDGDDTAGLYQTSIGGYFVKNSNGPGPADLVFPYGAGGSDWIHLSGDWDGDGNDTVGAYQKSIGVFFLKNTNAPGPADLTFQYGAGGDDWSPLIGDWDGDGDDTVGLYQTSIGGYFVKNSNGPGPADLVFPYGAGGSDWIHLSGDWDGDGNDTVGAYQKSIGVFFLRNTNAPGAADIVFQYGPGGDDMLPLVGRWG